MQRIYACELTVEQYIEIEGHRQVRPEGVCPRCGEAGRLHRHGTYWRGITSSLGQIVSIAIARFLCRRCRGTVSYLPEFAMSYRLVQTWTFEAFLEGRNGRGDVGRWQELLQQYRRRMTGHAGRVFCTVGCGFGRAPPVEAADPWPWLKAACGGLAAATRQLVTVFQITPFDRYQCHQPVRR